LRVAQALLDLARMVRYAVLVLLAGCFPYAIPPLKGELGASTHSRRPTAVRVAGGAHLASATLRRDQPFDVGVGGFYESAEGGFTTKGGYADAAWFIGLRGELRYDEMGRAGAGAKLRIDHEIFGPTTADYSASDTCSAIFGSAYGSGAAGIYVEAGQAWLPGNETAFVATAGVTLRMPMTAGVLIGIPGCK
jgi:hypothetical protein